MKVSSPHYESVVSDRKAHQKAVDIWFHVCSSPIGGMVGSAGATWGQEDKGCGIYW